MDRTAEFQRIVAERQSRRQGASSSSAAPPTIPLAPPTRTEFAAAASQIGSAISAVADKLGKLTQLAQSRSLFDEEGQGQEISALTFIIKQDITALNSRLNELQQAQRQRPRGGAKQRASHSDSVVDSLKTQLMTATKDFQDVLHTRSNNIKALQDRRNLFSATAPAAAAAAGGAGGAAAFAAAAAAAAPPPPLSIFELPAGSGCGGCGGAPSSSSFDGGGGEVVIDMSGAAQQQAQLVPTHSYLESRALAVESVQSTIVELGGIFDQLRVMVAEQGSEMQRVDENVDDALSNVEQGHQQLLRYWRRVSSNQGLMIRVFAVLMFFVVLFGTVM